MKIKTLSLSALLGIIGLLVMINAMESQASTHPSISCKTAFGEKSFTIEDSRVSIHKEDQGGISRSISSLEGQSVRTQKKHLGFTKTLYIEGNKHRISIANINEFSDASDYLSVTSPKGHEMTYPLTCHLL